MLAICFIYSLRAGHYADFSPINGTFQNFNPCRRLLAGQIPYKDFTDYLGMGHLYAGSMFTAFFGGTYLASLKAFSFLTLLSMALLSLMIGMAIFKTKLSAVIFTDAILMAQVTTPLFLDTLSVTEEIKQALLSSLSVGNSARFVRSMILPVVSFLFVLAYLFYKRCLTKYDRIRSHKNLVVPCGVGILAGFSFLWSNDYGISCWVCMSVLTFVYGFLRTGKIGRAFVILILEVMASFITVFILIQLFTAGHFTEWFSNTFGTGQYQKWYYKSDKSFYLFDADVSYLMLIQVFFCVAYMVKLHKAKVQGWALIRYGIPAFANMVSFCAVNEYKLLSGSSAKETALAVLFCTVSAELCRFAGTYCRWKNIRRMAGTAIAVTAVSWMISSVKDEMVFLISPKEGVYMEAMGGNVTALGKDLQETMEFLNGEKFFSTYASAQEVITGSYQPSGIDYIIHVLGDEQREDYLKSFETGDFKYAATIRDSFIAWERWVRKANWFFYRKLYQNWHPVYANTYELYWERNEDKKENSLIGDFEVEVQQVDASVKKLVIQTDTSVNGVADVYLDYACRKKDGILPKFLFQTMLKVEYPPAVYPEEGEYGDFYYLRSDGAEYIPVTIVDGYGEVVLTAMPYESVELDLMEVRCSDIYQGVSEEYIL